MKERLDDKYTVTSVVTLQVRNKDPKTISQVLNKEKFLTELVSAYKINHIDSYQYQILSIKFSNDKKAAFVGSTSVTYGTTSIPDKSSFHYINAEGCTDTLSVVEDKLRIMKSSCNGRETVE